MRTVTGSLVVWGNSQGVRIPKDVCELIGARVGDVVTMDVDAELGELTLRFSSRTPAYRRHRSVTLEELCKGYEGERVGEEWPGYDVGAEVVR